jgi:nitroimidazol reductase NimA-like FMN-containing flavoprotein (pyridoxamine 5'-phosphate oxidase superfamily)
MSSHTGAMTRPPLSPTERSTLTRHSDRARTDRAELDAVLDEGLICHLAFVSNGAPVVIPTCYGRDGDTLYLHGSTGASSLRAGAGTPVSVAVTLLDGIVYARTVFEHSANYRSVVVHGNAVAVTDEDTKERALRAITDHLAPGSWGYTRAPNRKEMAATAVLAVDLTESSLKVRSGDPGDEPEPGVWGGVLPIRQVWDEVISAPDTDQPVPAHVTNRVR